jgi:NAD(P)-dependent dehydrogenase (short-subunit alcohol dehydrogenase family)
MAEDELLAGRVAIVTGAASGMGRVMARATT